MVSSYPATPVTVDIAIANDHVPHRGVGDEVSFCAESSVDTLGDFEHRRKCVYDTLIACKHSVFPSYNHQLTGDRVMCEPDGKRLLLRVLRGTVQHVPVRKVPIG